MSQMQPIPPTKQPFHFPMVSSRNFSTPIVGHYHPPPQENNTLKMMQMMAQHSSEMLKISSEHKQEMAKKEEEMKTIILMCQEANRKLMAESEARTQKLMEFMLASNAHIASVANSTIGSYNTLVSQIMGNSNCSSISNSDSPVLDRQIIQENKAVPLSSIPSTDVPSTSGPVPATSATATNGRRRRVHYRMVYIHSIYIGRTVTVDENGEGTYKCKTCQGTFKTRQLLVNHYTESHGDVLHQKLEERAKTAQKRVAQLANQ